MFVDFGAVYGVGLAGKLVGHLGIRRWGCAMVWGFWADLLADFLVAFWVPGPGHAKRRHLHRYWGSGDFNA